MIPGQAKLRLLSEADRRHTSQTQIIIRGIEVMARLGEITARGGWIMVHTPGEEPVRLEVI
jgi:hypothetical protein